MRFGLHEVSLHFLALKRGFPEALAEKVLRSITSSVSTISRDRNDHLLIFFILGKDLFEAVRHVEKVTVLADSTLEKLWLYFESVVTTVSLLLLKLIQTVLTHRKVFLATLKSSIKIELFSVRIGPESIKLILAIGIIKFIFTTSFNA